MSKKNKSPGFGGVMDFVESDRVVQRFRSRFDGRNDEVRRAHTYNDESGEMITKQAFAAESDINNILKKYQLTGVLPDSSRAAMAQFGDFSNIPSYKESLEVVIDAQHMFSELPSAVRNRFRNDPGELLEFLSNPANRDEAAKLGLLDPSTGKPPLPPEVPGGRTQAEPAGSGTPPVAKPSEGE